MKSFKLQTLNTSLEQHEYGTAFGRAILKTENGPSIYFKFMTIDKLRKFIADLQQMLDQWTAIEESEHYINERRLKQAAVMK